MNTAPIIPWLGGKRRLAEHLIPRFPQHKCYVEVINDINGELIRLYRCVQHHLEEFIRQFK